MTGKAGFLFIILISICIIHGELSTSSSSESLHKYAYAGTCSEIDNQKTDSLDNCAYKWPTVTCKLVVKVKNKNTNGTVDTNSYFKLVMNFHMADKPYTNNTNASTENNDNVTPIGRVQNVTTHHCLTLKSVQIIKNNSHLDNTSSSRESYVDTSLSSFFIGFDLIMLQATFNSSDTVASLHLKEPCNAEREFPCTGVVNILQDIKILYEDNIALHDETFWAHLKTLFVNRLKGHIRLLHLVHSESVTVDVDVYLPNLAGFTIDELKIKGAYWPSVQRSMFPDFPQLKELYIADCQVDTTDEDLFNSTPNLERLSLSHNKLSDLPRSIASLKKLEKLDLSKNSLLNLSTAVNKMKDLSNLRWLDLSEIPFKRFELLKPLLQSKNEFNEVSIKLVDLKLKGCDLNVFLEDVDTFENVSSIINLDLSYNHFPIIPSNMFRSVGSLQVLNLAGNGLMRSLKLNMNGHKRLKLLNLSNNKLSNLEEIHISGEVEELDLSDNTISEWNNTKLFRKTTGQNEIWVKKLNLSTNAINFISENMKQSLSDLDSVDLGGNFFDCKHPSAPVFQKWLREDKKTVIFNLGTRNRFTCSGVIGNLTYITDVKFNDLSTPKPDIDYIFVVGVPVLVVLALVLLTIIGMYGYRFEISYVLHLISIRRQRYLRDNSSISQYKYDAFVSYSAVDRDWVVHELEPQLENGPEKYQLCFHERDFVLGSIIADNIVDCMKNSRNTIVVLTPHFVKSQWCRWELEVANHKLFEDDREFLILIELKKLNETKLPQHLSYLLDTRTYLEWPEGPGPHPIAWKRLKYALGESLYQRKMKAQSLMEEKELMSSADEETVI